MLSIGTHHYSTWAGRVIYDKRGSTVLEVALCVPLFLAAFLGLFEIGFALESNSAVQHSAAMAALYAVDHGYYADQNAPGAGCGPGTSGGNECAAMVEMAKAELAQNLNRNDIDLNKTAHVCVGWWPAGSTVGGYPASACTTDYAYAGTATDTKPGTVVSVQVVWTYQPFTRFGLGWKIPLTYTATGAVEY